MTERPPYRFRDDFIVQRRVFAGKVMYVVKDPIRVLYFHLDEMSFDLLALCDGKRDLPALLEAAGGEEGLYPGLDTSTLPEFYENYRKAGFLQDAWEKNVLLIERARTTRARTLKNAFANPLEITLPAWNPNRFFGKVVKPFWFLWTKEALLVYLGLFLLATYISWTHREEFALPMGQIFNLGGNPVVGAIIVWFVILGVAFLHECGHGATCKHFGGDVYKLGFLLLYFQPCLYCDVSESYFFTNKTHKHSVTLAGGVVDLVVSSLATFVWFLTASDLLVHDLAHRVAIYSSVSTIMVNYNPLLKFDGYYVLSDHLEMLDLRGDAFRYIGNRLRAFLGLPHDVEIVTPRERRIYWIYGVLAIAYSAFFLVFILMFFGKSLIHHFRAVGWVITAVLVFFLMKGQVKKVIRFARFFALDKGAHFRRHRITYGGAGLLLLGALLFAPVPRHVSGTFVLQPGTEVVLRARTAGVIDQVLVDEGGRVDSGAVPVIVRSEQETLDLAGAVAAGEEARARRARAQAAGDPAEASIRTADASRAGALEAYHASRVRGLSPASPIEGVVLTPRPRERAGLACAPGDTLLELGDLGTLRAEVHLDERLVGMVDPAPPAELRTNAEPGRVVRGDVELVALEPTGGSVRRMYRILVRVPNPDGRLLPGMSGTARFDAGRVPVLEHLWGSVTRVLRIEFWI